DRRYSVLYSSGREAFGRNQALRCPHLLTDGNCGVWRHRESTCATWFCKHTRGATGLAFWVRLHELLATIERSLSIWCLLELRFDVNCLDHLFRRWMEQMEHRGKIAGCDLDQESNIPLQKSVWGEWLGREREFYQRCARLVDPLTWADVCGICGPAMAAQSQILAEKYKELLSSAIPDRLKLGKVELVQISQSCATVTSYSSLDPVRLSRQLYDLLPFFSGQSTAEARQEILLSKRIDVPPLLLRRLIDYQILMADSSPTSRKDP
ncbi:MAG TPA: hypothetical protein VI685_06995, partial [Candidatus Angelobacter sp.]